MLYSPGCEIHLDGDIRQQLGLMVHDGTSVSINNSHFGQRQNSSTASKRFEISVADTGFPRGGGANSQSRGANLLFGQIFRKLHENERIWTGGGGVRVPGAPPP